jgi:hypothetical protein
MNQRVWNLCIFGLAVGYALAGERGGAIGLALASGITIAADIFG